MGMPNYAPNSPSPVIRAPVKMRGPFGPSQSISSTASRLVQPVLHGSWLFSALWLLIIVRYTNTLTYLCTYLLTYADRHTDHATFVANSNRPLLCTLYVRCGLKIPKLDGAVQRCMQNVGDLFLTVCIIAALWCMKRGAIAHRLGYSAHQATLSPVPLHWYLGLVILFFATSKSKSIIRRFLFGFYNRLLFKYLWVR